MEKENLNKDLKQEKSEPLKNSKKTFDSFFNKRFLICCVSSTLISACGVFVLLKIGLTYHDKQIEDLCESNYTLDGRVKSISDSIAALTSAMDELRSDWKTGKESSSYIYKTLSSLQKDVSIIKAQLHIDNIDLDDSIKKLPSTKSSFIEAFENLIKEGVPFDSFLESYYDKIDLKKYQMSNDIIKFSKLTIKPLSDLKKDMIAIGYKVFQTNVTESFWEKQKRMLKEKFSEIVKIKKYDENAKEISQGYTDKQRFEKADELLSNGDFEKSLKLLEEIKLEDEDLRELIVNIRKRMDLEKTFGNFKNEFLSIEGSEH